MVSFSCEVCNDTVIKKKLMGHFNRCPQAYFTCIDCNTTFEGTEFQKHTQCITEDQKYQGKLYKPKEKAATVEPKEKAVKVEPKVETKTAKVNKSKPKGAVMIKKAQTLDKVLKSLRKEHNLDKKDLLKALRLTSEGNLEWV
ncbi:hypothetical protein B9G98_02235 [Wickerhamiella sorbophila]|uniref:Zinc finger C2H2 LYAR-type domain-containing protein n=1 Tax=Wickerhamiella sorbophila TaxID=45607 RepID=A0A2T0FI09_9ASCO|nr:hypothetical protein B9G98_02235 [Wickerhamiella sorbophila]PRT54615.1 hypothetical protein B9G98_02235 [Wickerhamiella sorbophila]